VPPAPQQGPVHPGKWTTPSLKGTYVDPRFPKGNVRVASDLPGFDIKAVMHELELTPWGSRIADRIRGGDVELRILQELPPGYAAAASPNEIWLEFRPSVAEMASSIIHEGTHNLDPAIATYGTPESKSSRLAMESEARAFEYEYRREKRLPPYDEAEQAYRDAYDKAYIETGDEVAANISADKAMIEAMRRHPQRYAVETPAQEQAQRERAAKAAEGIMEDIAGAPLVGVDIGPFEDVPTSPGTSRFAHEKTSPGGPAFDPALMERMQKEEQLESALYARARAAAEHRLAYEAYQQAEATAGADLRGLTARREEALAKFAAADAEVKGLKKGLQDQKIAPQPRGKTSSSGEKARPASGSEAPTTQTAATEAESALQRLEDKVRSGEKPRRREIDDVEELIERRWQQEMGEQARTKREFERWKQDRGYSERINDINRGKARLQEAENVGGGAEHTSGARPSTQGQHEAGQSSKKAQSERARQRRLKGITE
jgi:hypothetical protein